jgi:molybdopterin-synthase adenylyltransferase
MLVVPERYNRSVLMFGAEGQQKLRHCKVTLIGAGGLGCIVGQHLGLVGIGELDIVDRDPFDETTRNRSVAAKNGDAPGNILKASQVKRLIEECNPDVRVRVIPEYLETAAAFDSVKSAHCVFGCFDKDGPRAILNELCAAYQVPLIDLASDVLEDGNFGGRVVSVWQQQGCLECSGELDRKEISNYFETEAMRASKRAIYGVDVDALDRKGPSVSPLNGVIASLAVMEFVAVFTEMREPIFKQTYNGTRGILTKSNAPSCSCRICGQVRGKREAAAVERYILSNALAA